MGVSINTFKNYCDYLINKEQSGASYTINQFNILCSAAQLVPYKQDYETYSKTGVASNFLKTFLSVGETVIQTTPTNKIIPYPTDFEYVGALRYYYNNTQYKASYIDNNQIADVLRPNSLIGVTPDFNKYTYGDDGLIVYGDNNTWYLDYFKTPTPPIWNYTIVNNQPVYNPVGSVDFAFEYYSMNLVAGVFLGMIGINLQEPILEKFAAEFQAENKTIT